ncbi:MAG: glycerol kinase GlpK [Bacteroidota bacterium]|nr:glycerol kinase GlpK [Bacteroidota bacterium]MDP4195303.1 glycerol kinase GlpK [Bacteroidota bacterium]
MEKFILALDQGTTSSRAIIFDRRGKIKSMAQKEFKQFYPQTGWVEHDPLEIWSSQLEVLTEAMKSCRLDGKSIAAIGITNQRETTVIWDKQTGLPIYNAIVWQDRRTSEYCTELKRKGVEEKIRSKTGLLLDAYFSATKVKWILDNVKDAREKAEQGRLAFGTVDSWLIWNLSDKAIHITDITNASRTMLFNIHKKKWDSELLEMFDIPASILPEVRSSSEVYGKTKTEILGLNIPISGVVGDQQSALFGQMCIYPGMLKNTYGTGGFLMLNTGERPIVSKNNLLTTVAWEVNGKVTYALEGSIFVSGAVVQWLRDGLGIIKSSAEIENLAGTVKDNGGVYFVPAFTGLGAPNWDQFARGVIFGLTRGTSSGHIARAAIESIAFQTLDVLKAMEYDSEIKVLELRVDGGATINNLLMQIQADILDIPIIRPKVSETTALGVAYLAGLAVGYWKEIEEIINQWEADKKFVPQANREHIIRSIDNWNRAVDRSKNWLKDETALKEFSL